MNKEQSHSTDFSAIAIVLITSASMISLAVAFFTIKSFVAASMFIGVIPVSLILTKVIDLKKLLAAGVVAVLLSSCVSPYYWGSTATAHGARAQNKYIKNQKGHNPHKRFHASQHQPTFGAQELSRR